MRSYKTISYCNLSTSLGPTTRAKGKGRIRAISCGKYHHKRWVSKAFHGKVAATLASKCVAKKTHSHYILSTSRHEPTKPEATRGEPSCRAAPRRRRIFRHPGATRLRDSFLKKKDLVHARGGDHAHDGARPPFGLKTPPPVVRKASFRVVAGWKEWAWHQQGIV